MRLRGLGLSVRMCCAPNMIRSVFRLLFIPVKLFTGLVLVFVLLWGLRFSLFINAILSILSDFLFYFIILMFTVIAGLGMGVVEVHSAYLLGTVAYFFD